MHASIYAYIIVYYLFIYIQLYILFLQATFQWEDALNLNSLLNEEEVMLRDSFRSYCQQKLMPRIIKANRNEGTIIHLKFHGNYVCIHVVCIYSDWMLNIQTLGQNQITVYLYRYITSCIVVAN